MRGREEMHTIGGYDARFTSNIHSEKYKYKSCMANAPPCPIANAENTDLPEKDLHISKGTTYYVLP